MEYAKYIKYKNKYLNLLNQKAGSDFYLPCEITHYTSTAYYSKYNREIPEHIINSIDNIDYGYIQDIYIQLYNSESYKTIVTSEMDSLVKPLFFIDKIICNEECCTCSYTFNFSERITKTFTRDEDIPNIYKKCEPRNCTNKINTRIGYNSFTNDEYIGVEYKINDKDILIREQSKGGNYISAPNNTIFYIDGTNIIIDEILKINKKLNCVELKCNFKSVNNTFRHIDEIMCFMPYGKNKYKIWFYNEFTRKHFNLSSYSNEKICELNIERLENLNKISQALFGQSFENSHENFVFFDFYIWTQSIFNRTWYEQSDKCICLFPNLVSNPELIYNKLLIDNLITNVKNEMKKVKSYIDDKIPTFIFIDVKEANSEKPEGTLHCMIKQRFIKVE